MILKKSYLQLCQISPKSAITLIVVKCTIIYIMLNSKFNNALYLLKSSMNDNRIIAITKYLF